MNKRIFNGIQYEVYSAEDFPYQSEYEKCTKCYTKSRRNQIGYFNEFVTFDIEITSVRIDKKKTHGFMYLWSACFFRDMNDFKVILGRTWDDFILFCNNIINTFGLSYDKKIIFFVHNFGFEFAFLYSRLDFSNIFAKAKRKILKGDVNGIEFRCSYFLTNMSLKKFTEKTEQVRFKKLDGKKFNYHKYRDSNTPLEEYELDYSICDVVGLAEGISTKLRDDTLATLPLTSTGYVRRDVRNAMRVNPKNREIFIKLRLSVETYLLCKEASRGGNTHANPFYSEKLLTNVDSYDKKSSYPASIIMDKYPMTAFQKIDVKYENVFQIIERKACLIEVCFEDIEVKTVKTIAYISKSRCKYIERGRFDNGRILSASKVWCVITDIDYKIIRDVYNINGRILLFQVWAAEYGLLPYELRKETYDYFYKKTTLDGVDDYLYMKSKNSLNSIFGMMLTAIVHDEITFDKDSEEIWKSEKPSDIGAALDKYYKSRNSFLAYQWGTWTTAIARKRLQDGINLVGEDIIYTDTDCVKFIGEHDFTQLNKELERLAMESDIPAYVDYNGQRFTLGVWEHEKNCPYKEFITMGAKKYAYTTYKDDLTHITISGVAKDDGSEYITKKGGIKNFKVGFRFPQGKSGRTVCYYNDDPDDSNIAVFDSTYVLGNTEEYEILLEEMKNLEIYVDSEE